MSEIVIKILFQFRGQEFQLRTPIGHDRQCTLVENSEIDLSIIYGINFRSVLNSSRYFHVIGGVPGDAMHDVLEGILQYEAKELLKYCIREEKLFTLPQLNENILSFDFGYMNDSNKPSPIAPQTLASESNSLKQKGKKA